MNKRVFIPSALGSAVLASAATAAGEVVYFVNPAPGQPGHFNWFAPQETLRFLDVTLPAALQPNAENGTSIGQGFFGLPAGGVFGLMRGTAAGPGASFLSSFAVASPSDPAVLALSASDVLAGRTFEYEGQYAAGQPPLTTSLFPEDARRYIGLRTDDGHYGWIEVQRAGLSLSAFSWAYETTPNTPIVAGQVPAPGTAAIAAVAALGAAPMRRRRPARPDLKVRA